MKTKKLTLSLDNLALGKETVLNLTANQMGNIVGGVTEPTDSTCHSVAGCSSFDTNCWSACQTGCDTSGSSWCSDTGYTFCYC